eukprot:CAMPEP_0172487874 /NCGR_PEP_ID=MMETSP1066-20121228/17150_1 /TAXON_ID=671091 /ORGANISM="Coscinodiscus wailesii, Strain CCMP2513" /LENGTH=433 /DNA_ID=CAMNT_0013254753 /DNA_START=51 /DNA_END=1352 /DNA_ORIENTATION=+
MAKRKASSSSKSRSDTTKKRKVSSSSSSPFPSKSRFDNDTWLKKYDALKKFKTKTGHFDVPSKYDECPNLRNWVNRQRYEYRSMKAGMSSCLTTDRLSALETIDFPWEFIKDDAWEKKFEELKQFKKRYGHTQVPAKCKENPTLGNWVAKQRYQYRLTKEGKKNKKTTTTTTTPPTINDRRIKALDDICFEWEPNEDTWNKHFEALKQFQCENGHCLVPKTYGANPILANWVASQRFHYKMMVEGRSSNMTFERVDALNSINFNWQPNGDITFTWDEQYEKLKHFKSLYGHCQVPRSDYDDKSLVYWIDYQRKQYKLLKAGMASFMTSERVDALDELDFNWEGRAMPDAWRRQYKELEKYKRETGDCQVPVNYGANPSLAKWVRQQRKQYSLMKAGKKTSMNIEKMKSLEALDFSWKVYSGAGKHCGPSVFLV